MKCRSLFNYKLNEFALNDLINFATIIDGIAILVTGGYLHYSAEYNYNENFHIPPINYDEYMRWVENSEYLLVLRNEIGIFVIIQMLNLLLIASDILPSLGILFRTIEKSMADIFVFSTICLLMFSVFVVIVYVSFGEHNYQFSEISMAMVACFQMLLGEFPYTAMYKADSYISGIILVLFVVIMNFMMLNMYTAIVIRTYNKLQERQLFLGESMAHIVKKHAEKKAVYWKNVICCNSTFKKGKSDAD